MCNDNKNTRVMLIIYKTQSILLNMIFQRKKREKKRFLMELNDFLGKTRWNKTLQKLAKTDFLNFSGRASRFL